MYLSFFVRNLIIFSVAGCSTITINSDGNEVKIDNIFGSRIINRGQKPIYINIDGFGVFIENESLNIGWISEKKVIIEKLSCQVVILSESVEQVNELIKLTNNSSQSLNNICVFESKK